VRRRLFTLGAVVSLLLCAVTAVLWARSYDGDERWFGRTCIMSHDGELGVFRLIPNGVTQFEFHYWWVALLLSATPLFWIAEWGLDVRRRRRGLCPICSYDLTGNTSGVCPECGKPIMPAPARRRTG